MLFVGLYLAIGWCVVVAAGPLVAAVPPGGIALLVAGGLACSGGVAFYLWRRLPFHHALWHVCVPAGSAFHYAAPSATRNDHQAQQDSRSPPRPEA